MHCHSKNHGKKKKAPKQTVGALLHSPECKSSVRLQKALRSGLPSSFNFSSPLLQIRSKAEQVCSLAFSPQTQAMSDSRLTLLWVLLLFPGRTIQQGSAPFPGWLTCLEITREHLKALRLDFTSRARRAAGAAPPTLATQLNNGDILGAPARRSPAPAAPLRLSRPPLPPPHAPGGPGPRGLPRGPRRRAPAGGTASPARRGHCPWRRRLSPGLRGGKGRERKGRGRVPPPPRSASGGAPRARAAAARSRRREGSGLALRQRARNAGNRRPPPRAARPRSAALTAGFLTKTFREHPGIEAIPNIKGSSEKASVWNHCEMLYFQSVLPFVLANGIWHHTLAAQLPEIRLSWKPGSSVHASGR